jgi:hypothetical protein
MDYTGILKRAWDVTWRYKILWLFGFFAGTGSYGGSGSRYSYGNGSQPFSNVQAMQARQFLAQYGGAIIAAVVGLVIFGLILGIIGIAARGALIHLVNEAEEGREVRAGAGWKVGFSKWWRIFGILFLTSLPVLIIVVIISAMFGAAFIAAIRAGSSQAFVSSFGGALAGGVCLAFVLGLLAIFFGIVLGIAGELGVRYAVLKDMRVIESIKQGWHDLFGHRGAFLMFLVMVVVGIVFGIAVGILGILWVALPFLLIIGIPVLIVVGSVYGAFQQAAWTIFFRRMTGMEMAPAMAAGAPAAYPGNFPPAPPMAPPAPPMMPPAPPAAPGMQAPPAPYPPAPPVAPVYAPPAPPEYAPPVPPAPPAYEPPAPPAPPVSDPPAAPTDV